LLISDEAGQVMTSNYHATILIYNENIVLKELVTSKERCSVAKLRLEFEDC
jgi:hypothetical protein